METTPMLDKIADVSSRVLSRLPAALIMLCLMNIAALGLVFWFIHVETDSKLALIREMLRACYATMNEKP